MPGFTFDIETGLADKVFGKCQHPIRMFIERRGEEFEKRTNLPSLFMMETTENYGNVLSGMTSMKGFEPVGNNGAHPADSIEEGYSKFLGAVTWKDSFSLSAESIEDGQMTDLKKAPAAFMVGYERTREKFGAALYAGAMQGKTSVEFRGRNFDICGADGKPIFCTEHVNKVDKATQCNMFSDEFSIDALDAVESEMHLFTDDNGEILDLEPDTILIPEDPVLKRQVFAVIGADKDPVTSNNAFNYQFGRWNVTVWPYLNQFLEKGLKPWVMVDSKYNQTYGGGVWHDRLKLKLTSDIDRNTDANVWYGRSRYNATFYDWRFAALGGVAGGKALV